MAPTQHTWEAAALQERCCCLVPVWCLLLWGCLVELWWHEMFSESEVTAGCNFFPSQRWDVLSACALLALLQLVSV